MGIDAANSQEYPGYYGWSRDQWNQYSQQYGNSGTPIFHNNRVIGVKNSSVDLESTAAEFNSRTTSGSASPTTNPVTGNPTVNPHPPSNEEPTNRVQPNNPALTPNNGNNTPPPTAEEFIAQNRERNNELREQLDAERAETSAFRAQATSDINDLVNGQNAFEPNPLSAVDSPTYNIKLILVNPLMGALDVASQGGGVIVAQSGVTTQFNITDCRINQHVGNVNGRTDTFGSEIFLTIEEPYGFTLPERIVAACQGMGIQNHMVAEYVVEISFKGTDPTHGGPSGDLAAIKWRIPCVIAQMKMNIGATSRYDMVLYDTGDTATGIKHGIINHNISVSGATLGEWFDNFTIALNEQEEKQVTGGGESRGISIPNQYEFEIEGKHRAYVFSQLDPMFLDSNSKHGFQLDSENAITVNIAKGTSIVEMIKIVFLATTDYQRRLRYPGGDTGAQPAQVSSADIASAQEAVARDLKNIIRIDNSSDPIAYDPKRNDYARLFKYVPYEHTQLNSVLNATEYLNTRADTQRARTTARHRLSQLFSKKLLKKRYDHRFTGVNTEVLNADVNLDNLFYNATEIFAGVHNDAGNYIVGDRFNTYQEQGVREYNTTGQLVTGASGSGANPNGTPSIPGIKYLEEVDYRQKAYTSFANKTFAPDNIPNDSKFGPVRTPTGGLNAMGQIHYNLMTGDMLELSLSIKGDPYWLGQNRLARRGQGNNQGSYADYQSGSNSFLFVMRTPEGYDENTGQTPNMVEADTIAGIYMVVGVEHIFQNGMFTQTLIAYMEDTMSFGLIRTLV